MFVMIYSSHIQAFRLETSECSTQIGDDGEACIMYPVPGMHSFFGVCCSCDVKE